MHAFPLPFPGVPLAAVCHADRCLEAIDGGWRVWVSLSPLPYGTIPVRQHPSLISAQLCNRRPTPWRGALGLLLALGLALLVSAPAARAQSLLASGPPAADGAPPSVAQVYLHNRPVAAFRADQLGDSAAERAALAQQSLKEALAAGGPGQVTRTTAGDAVQFEIDGRPVFFLTVEDLGGAHQTSALSAAAHQVQLRLQKAVAEHHEMSDLRQIGIGLAYTLAATLLVWGLMWTLMRSHRWLHGRLLEALRGPGGALAPYVAHARSALRGLTTAVAWVLGLLVADAWLTFVLRQFAYTRPWGERSTAWMLQLAEQFARGMAGAVPGVFVAVVIFLLARVVTRANAHFLQRVASGETRMGWLDADTALPTQRLSNVLIWLFALAMAYPYLPGAQSEAFKGVSVLAGLMLSLGASGVIGQAMSGFSLVYSRSLRVGEFVKIGDTEGTVSHMGLFATRIHTGMGEEVSLPNAVIFSQPVRNFSRLVQDGRFVLHTSVTIGYSSPWRQVHAMLLEAARRTPGVANEPMPYVVQTALSDFYVEYRLCAQSNRAAPSSRVEAMSQLHANVQDVFNENGVQIMSPHYRSDPPEPQIVAPGDPWSAGQPGAPLTPPGSNTTRP
jgi:small-conductance mechanosensitive channel